MTRPFTFKTRLVQRVALIGSFKDIDQNNQDIVQEKDVKVVRGIIFSLLDMHNNGLNLSVRNLTSYSDVSMIKEVIIV